VCAATVRSPLGAVRYTDLAWRSVEVGAGGGRCRRVYREKIYSRYSLARRRQKLATITTVPPPSLGGRAAGLGKGWRARFRTS